MILTERTSSLLAIDERNRRTQFRELAWLQTHPDKVFLYVQLTPTPAITTWLGLPVAENVQLGPSRTFYGACMSTRRSVRCTIYGQRYTGWYFESSGDYCRLRKAR